MSYIIDADWIIEITRNNRQAITTVERLLPARVAVAWLTLGEVYEAAFRTPNPEARIAELKAYVEQFATLGMDADITYRYAEIRAYLRRRGGMISEADMVVAATALSRDLTVLTYNRRHFERIPDLRVHRADG